MTGARQHGDARALLRSLPDGIGAAAFFDPQHRSTLQRLQYGNEGARQKLRCALPAMSDSYIEQCCRDIARVLRPRGYLFLWTDAFRLCRGDHRQVTKVLPCVDLIAWDNGRFGMPAATSSPMTASIPARCRRISATRTSSTRCAIPSWRRPASSISGAIDRPC